MDLLVQHKVVTCPQTVIKQYKNKSGFSVLVGSRNRFEHDLSGFSVLVGSRNRFEHDLYESTCLVTHPQTVIKQNIENLFQVSFPYNYQYSKTFLLLNTLNIKDTVHVIEVIKFHNLKT